MKTLATILAACWLATATLAKAGELDSEYFGRDRSVAPAAVALARPPAELDAESPTQACFFGRRFFGFGGFGYGYPGFGFGYARGFYGYPGFGFGGFGWGRGFGGFGGGRGFGGFGYGRGFGFGRRW